HQRVRLRTQPVHGHQLRGAEQLLAILVELTINVTTPDFGCYSGEFWAVSQAAPMRRVRVNGLATLMDYCTGPSFASGGFIHSLEVERAQGGTRSQAHSLRAHN